MSYEIKDEPVFTIGQIAQLLGVSENQIRNLAKKRVHIPKPLPETGFVRLPDVLHHVGISKSKWYAGVKSGEYPQSVSLGPNSVAWRAEDVRALLSRISTSRPSGSRGVQRKKSADSDARCL